MPIDGNYIQGTIASQQAYFAQTNAQYSAMNRYVQDPGSYQGPPPAAPPAAPPPPPMPSAVWSTGLSMPPNTLQPQYTSTGSAIRGYMGGGPSSFSNAENRFAAEEQLRWKARDFYEGSKGAIAEAAPMATNLIGWEAGAALGTAMFPGLGTVAGGAIGLGVGALVGGPAGALAGAAVEPMRREHQTYKMARQMQVEMQADPKLRRFSGSFESLQGLSTDMYEMASRGQAAGEDISIESISNVASLGVAGGQFETSKDIEEFSVQLKKYLKNTKKVSKILKVSLDEAGTMLNELKQMGFFDQNSQMRQLEDMISAANLGGIGVSEVAGASMAGMQIAGAGGAAMATTAVGRAGYMMSQGGRGANLIQGLGGAQQAAIGLTQSTAGFLQQTPMGMAVMAGQLGGAGGFGGGFSDLSLNPQQFAMLQTQRGQQEIMGQMGGNASLMALNKIQTAMEKSGMSTDPHTMSLMMGGAYSVDQIEAMREMNNPEFARGEMKQRLSQGFTAPKVGGIFGWWDESVTQNVQGGKQLWTESQLGRKSNKSLALSAVSKLPGMGWIGAAQTLKDMGDTGEDSYGSNWMDIGKEVDQLLHGRSFAIHGWAGMLDEDDLDRAIRRRMGSTEKGIARDAANAEEELEGIIPNDMAEEITSGTSKKSQYLREHMYRYVTEGDEQSRRYIEGHLRDKGIKNPQRVLATIKENSSEIQKHMETLQANDVSPNVAQLKKDVRNLRHNKRLQKEIGSELEEFAKTGSRDSFRALAHATGKISPEARKALKSSGTPLATELLGGAAAGSSISDMYSSLMTETYGIEGTEAAKYGGGAQLSAKTINIDSPAEIIINNVSNKKVKDSSDVDSS